VNIKQIIIEYVTGLITSIIGFFVFSMLFNLPWASKLGSSFGGDKTSLFAGLLLGLPIGSLVGIFFIDKFLFKIHGHNLWGVALGFLLSFILGGISGVFLLDKIGNFGVFVIPLLICFLSLLGYYLPLLKD
jgi:hypothetical protein